MLVSVYLPQEVHDILTVYGELSDVVNDILLEGDKGSFNIMDKPNYGSRQGCNKYEIIIENETYINLLKKYAVNSSRISLRRLLTWFVYDEIYLTLGWKPVRKYVNREEQKFIKLKNKIESDLLKLQRLLKSEQAINKIDTVIKIIKEV